MATWKIILGLDVQQVVRLAWVAALKQATSSVVSGVLFESCWFLIFTVEFKNSFGLWFLGNLLPRVTWAAANDVTLLSTLDLVWVQRNPKRKGNGA